MANKKGKRKWDVCLTMQKGRWVRTIRVSETGNSDRITIGYDQACCWNMSETLIKKIRLNSSRYPRQCGNYCKMAFYRVLRVKCRISICENPPLHTGISQLNGFPPSDSTISRRTNINHVIDSCSRSIDILIRTTIGLRSLLIVEQFLQRWESILLKRAHWTCVSTMLSMICWLFPRCLTWLSVVSMAQSQSGLRPDEMASCLGWKFQPAFSFVTIQDFSGDVVFSTRVTISWKPRYLRSEIFPHVRWTNVPL